MLQTFVLARGRIDLLAQLAEAGLDLGQLAVGPGFLGQTRGIVVMAFLGECPGLAQMILGTAQFQRRIGRCSRFPRRRQRLRRILQNPPAEYVALHKAGFQYRFFQFQSDLRNGPTGYKKISSFEDHLVKWVTVINAQGVCEQPTLSKFRDYARAELTRRKLPLPEGS